MPPSNFTMNSAVVTMYGVLFIYSLFILYESHEIIDKARNSANFDPINESIASFLNTPDIYTKLSKMLSQSDKKK